MEAVPPWKRHKNSVICAVYRRKLVTLRMAYDHISNNGKTNSTEYEHYDYKSQW